MSHPSEIEIRCWRCNTLVYRESPGSSEYGTGLEFDYPAVFRVIQWMFCHHREELERLRADNGDSPLVNPRRTDKGEYGCAPPNGESK